MKLQTIDAFEIKFAGDETTGEFTGYAAVFGEPDSFGDVVEPGAFKRSLTEHKSQGTQPAMFWQHRQDEPIGVWQEMSEDGRGLKVRGQPRYR